MTGELDGRRLLFIDDRLDVANMYIKRATAEGAECVYRSRLVSGLEAVVAENLDAVVVDLHMPAPQAPWPQAFASSIELLLNHPADMVRKHNLGQILGHFISSVRGGRPPYLYVSAVAEYFVQIDGCPTLTQPPCFNRFNLTSALFIEEVVKVINAGVPSAP